MEPFRRCRLVLLLGLGGCVGSIGDWGQPAGEPAGEPEGASAGLPAPGGPSSVPTGDTGTAANKTGTAGGTAPTGGDSTTPGAIRPDERSACKPTSPAPVFSPYRRLNRDEYNNTVRDLLGDVSAPATGFAPDDMALGYDNNAAALTVSGLLAEQYEAAARELAAAAVKNLDRLLGCSVAQKGEDACASAFIASMGLRAYRRPPSQAEQMRLYAFYRAAKAGADFPTAIRMVVQAVLQAPQFFYRLESGIPLAPGSAVARLGPFEVASRLSYFLWRSMPDQALFEAAGRGELVTTAEVEAQARRMLGDARARPMIDTFYRMWLDLDGVATVEKDAKVFPKFRSALRPLFAKETALFIDSVIASRRFETLFDADYTFVNKELGIYYGLPSAATGDAFVRTPGDPRRRAGFLTQATVMAAHAGTQQSNPVTRGFFVRDALLCAPPPPPPANVAVRVPEISTTATTRERFTQHRSDPACAACHALMDPLGLGFENYDAVGIWRDTENGKPVDAGGEILNTVDANGRFDGPAELGRRLAGSVQVRQCFVRQWFRFAYGRGETPEDQCVIDSLTARLSAVGGGDVKELLVALTQTDVFLHRRNGSP